MLIAHLSPRPRGASPAARLHATTRRYAEAGLRRYGWTALRVGICAALLLAAVAAAGRVDASVELRHAPALGLALILIALQVTTLALAWSAIIGRVGGASITTGASTFLAGWLGRYIPGPQTGPAAKFAAARRLGLPCRGTAGALILEQALQLAVVLVLVAATVPALAGPWGLGWSMLALSGAAVIGVGILRPQWPMRLCPRSVRGRRVADSVPQVQPATLLVPVLLFGAANVLSGLSLHVLAVGLGGWSPAAVAESVCIVSLATLAGSLAPVPSGLGVREGIIVALLGPTIGAPLALTIAVLARALAVLFDAALGAALVLHRAARTLRWAARAVQAAGAAL